MSLKRNLIANYLGQIWTAALGIAFVPLYVKALGIESYGLVGVFSVLQASLTLLDLGLTPTLSREMSRLRGGAHTPESIRDLLRSLEFIYMGLAGGLILAVWFAAPWLTSNWLRVDDLPASTVIESIRIMGFVLATRWVEQIYRGVLVGIQDQVWLNLAQAGLATLRWGGALFIVTLVSPTIVAFFAWQGAVSCFSGFTLVRRAYRMLPSAKRAGRFDFMALREIRAFASGMFMGAILAFALMQADKIVMSKLLPLDQLGYYMLAQTLSGGLLQLAAPMNNAVYPQLTVHATTANNSALADTYLRACEWLAAIIVPPALLMTIFAGPVLQAWTGDQQMTRGAATLLSLLALGTLCNGFMNLPHLLQISHGWTSLTVWSNTLAAALVIPALIYAVPRYGAIGAASIWLALNAGYVLLIPSAVFHRLLHHVKWRWYKDAVAGPVCAGSAAGALLLFALPATETRSGAFLYDLAALLGMYVAVGSCVADVRRFAWRLLVIPLGRRAP